MKFFVRYRFLLISVFLCILIALVIHSVGEIRRYALSGNLQPRYPVNHFFDPRSEAYRPSRPLPLPLNQIETWMTFDYLNRSYQLPPEYLRAELGIQEARYPNLSIRRYGQLFGLDDTQALVRVKRALQDYATSTKVTPIP